MLRRSRQQPDARWGSAPAGPSLPPPSPPVADGLTVGPYRLLARIGEGGMGVVHLARREDGHRVALKVLRPHVVSDEEARERLAREVAALRMVRGPRIAEVLDADPWGEMPYVATRYVPGLSLHDHVRAEGPLDPADLTWFADCLAEAVLTVHAVGVLHRDIKPANVVMEGRSPVLIDFGLARPSEDPRLTRTGVFLGTIGYVAPEIIYGDEATTASDVHAWAATVAFAGTGRPPFGDGGMWAVMDRVRQGDHDLAGLPAATRGVVEAALAPRPVDRPTMSDALAELRPQGADTALTAPVVAGFAPGAGSTAVTAAAAAPTTRLAPTSVQPALAPPRTLYRSREHAQPLPTRVAPSPQAPPPSQQAGAEQRTGAGSVLLRTLLGMLTTLLVVAGTARAPYLAPLALAAVLLVVRSLCWSQESLAARRWRRGRRRWFDRPGSVLAWPWYLLVAVPGTVLLVGSGTVLALFTGVGLALAGVPVLPGLLVMAAVLAFSVWWGPGSRRVRTPAHAVTARLTANPVLGLTSCLVVAAALGVVSWFLLQDGVTWEPAYGPPWREGGSLDFLSFLRRL